MDKRLLTVVMVAVLVALVITAIFYQITVGRRPAQSATATREVVVAKRDLPMGAAITEADVRLMDYPEAAYPQGAFSSIDEVVDRSIVQPILANEPILAGRVSEKGAGFGLAPLIPEGMRAVAVAVNQVSGVSGFILPGSKVDVLLTARPEGANTQMTTTVLENVTVLSTAHRLQPNANGQPENVPVMNMLLTPEQAELLTLATAEGRIQLVLRNPTDEEQSAEERRVKRTADLFAKGIQEERPAPRPAPRVIIKTEPAPPPPAPVVREIEMIRGDRRSVEEIDLTQN